MNALIQYVSSCVPCNTQQAKGRSFSAMEQGQYQDLEDICFSDVGPLSIGTWENYNPVHLGRLAGTCVWTVEPPDGILPGNPHCLSFRSSRPLVLCTLRPESTQGTVTQKPLVHAVCFGLVCLVILCLRPLSLVYSILVIIDIYT
ncbi:hypothetical protein N1851_030846 [Merluccius polli]|uniref:Uncharacterized protein n=1 Tax=Merluccius polli TaxID=89951 RepID=A0AA47M4Q9_MERPO|nr:hypothetical protein N1851_030846 [Merluccius polli]